MSFFSSQKKEDKIPSKIIISRSDKIGDMVLSMPSFFMARKMYPKAEISVIASLYNAPLIKYSDYIDRVIPFDSKRPQDTAEVIKNIRADEFIALFSDKTVLKLAAISKAKKLIGPISKPLSWFVYDSGILQRRSKSVKNEAEYNLDLIRESNHKLYDENFEIAGRIKYSTNEEKEAASYLENLGIKGKFIIIHMFCGGSAKNFTLEEYACVINKLSAKIPAAPIILTAHGNEYNELSKIKSFVASKNIHFYQTGDILSFTALIDKCCVFAGGSTGPTHIAGNLRKKTLAIFPAKKSQSKTRWGLFGNDENTTYIIPDKENPSENYNSKTFDNVTDNVLEQAAFSIADKFLAE